MTRIFTLFALSLFSLLSVAVSGQSRLSIASTNNAPLRVMVDGNKYRTGSNAVMISNLKDGYHSIKVYQLRNAPNNRRAPQGNMQGGGYQLVYSANLLLRSRYHTDITINRFGKAFVDDQLMGNNYYDEEDDDWGDMPGNRNERRDEAMDGNSFEQLKATLKGESFEDNRKSVAKMAIQGNFFKTAQVKELVSLFTFDDNRLEMAKFAYDNTIDKNNYYLLNSVFSFSSAKEALAQFIQSKNKQQ